MSENTSEPRRPDIQIVDDNPENLNIPASILQRNGSKRNAATGNHRAQSGRGEAPSLPTEAPTGQEGRKPGPYGRRRGVRPLHAPHVRLGDASRHR